MRFALFGPTREAFGSFMAISRKVFTCEADCYVSLSMTTLVMLDSKYAPFLKWALIYRSADDVDATIFLCPFATFVLQRLPRTAIEGMSLRTHIGHIETVVHGFLAPFHVGSRTHVTSIIATLLVFIPFHAVCLWHCRVCPEFL